MSCRRVQSYAWSRPVVWIFGLLGLALLARGSAVAGMICLGIAAYKLLRLLHYPGMDERLRLREQKLRAGVHRRLTPREQRELFALDAYATALVRQGGDASLAEEIRTRAFAILRDAGSKDASDALARFRQDLPPIETEGEGSEPDLARRIQEELELLRATRREVGGL